MVKLLVSAGADVDSQDNRKVFCLMAAFRKVSQCELYNVNCNIFNMLHMIIV